MQISLLAPLLGEREGPAAKPWEGEGAALPVGDSQVYPDFCPYYEKRNQVIEMARNGVEPFHGYNVAFSFLAFLRWKYREGDHGTAVEFAEIATRADETWAEPDFILGWYSLVLGGGDAMAHLARAVRKDSRMLSRIVQDPVCGRHPHIIRKLTKLSVDDIAMSRDQTGADNGDAG